MGGDACNRDASVIGLAVCHVIALTILRIGAYALVIYYIKFSRVLY